MIHRACRYGPAPLLLLAAILAVAQQPSGERLPTKKAVTVYIEGDTSMIPKFINLAREKAPERNLDLTFTRDKDVPYHVHVVLSAEGASLWSYAHGNVVVMDSKGNVLFTVTRSLRWTEKGATSALTKEFVKMLARYYSTHN